LRRFYKTASVVAADGAFEVQLDGKAIKTPQGKALAVKSLALAEEIAREWSEQGDEIQPAGMLLTKLANTTLDRNDAQRDLVIAEVLKYAGGDLLCYRAEDEALAERQREAWDPLLKWLEEKHNAPLAVTVGINHILQPADAVLALGEVVRALDPYALTGVHAATTLSGSLALALAISEGRIDAETAFRLAHIDETYQAEKWGEDHEAVERLKGLAKELQKAADFLTLSRP
jgi:chaperone required for assembly of F1-ATPase